MLTAQNGNYRVGATTRPRAMGAETANRIKEFVLKLIAEGESLLKTEWVAAGNWVSAPPRYVDLTGFAKFTAQCRQLLHMLGERAAPWRTALEYEDVNYSGIVKRQIGTLRAIMEAIDAGLLLRVEELAIAETFSNLMEQADYLFQEGYFLASGVLGRAVLEEHLRKWCERSGCMPEKSRPTLGDLTRVLHAKSIVDKLTMKHVEAMAAVGNDAAHNNPSLAKEDVARLLRDTREFLTRHSLDLA
jgi:hypothetical protein